MTRRPTERLTSKHPSLPLSLPLRRSDRITRGMIMFLPPGRGRGRGHSPSLSLPLCVGAIKIIWPTDIRGATRVSKKEIKNLGKEWLCGRSFGARSSTVLSGGSGAQFNKKKICLKFWLKKQLEFWLEIPYTKKKLKIGKFRHVPESKLNLKPFFKPNLKPKFCLPGSARE